METSSTQAARRELSAAIVVRHPKIVFNIVDEEAVLLNVDSGKYFGLDDIGTDIWDRIQVPVGVDALCVGLTSEYDGSAEDIRRDVLFFLDWLADNGLVEVRK